MPSVEKNFGDAREKSHSSLLAYLPLVQGEDELDLWSNYSLAQHEWLYKDNVDATMDPVVNYVWEHPNGELSTACGHSGNSNARPLIYPDDRIPITPVSDNDNEGFAPIWTYSRATNAAIINLNLLANQELAQSIDSVNNLRCSKFVHVCNLPSWFGLDEDTQLDTKDAATIVHPVFGSFSNAASIVDQCCPVAELPGNCLLA